MRADTAGRRRVCGSGGAAASICRRDVHESDEHRDDADDQQDLCLRTASRLLDVDRSDDHSDDAEAEQRGQDQQHDLYARVFDGVPLGPNDYVISADEKSQLQALRRCHPGRPPGPGQLAQVELEYERGGTLAYMGAYDVHRAHLYGTIADKTGIVSFMELVDKVMTQEPYASARTVYWVVDNGSSHIGKRSIERMTAAWPNARLVHLPVHASWLNQIEIVFSIIQRKVVKPADFADFAVLADRLQRFEHRYNQTARPFDWRFTRNDLTAMLRRLDAHRVEPDTNLAA